MMQSDLFVQNVWSISGTSASVAIVMM